MKINSTKKDSSKSAVSMSLVGHLTELRKRLFLVAIVFLIATIACMTQTEWFVQILIDKAKGFQFVYIAPAELVITYVKLALTGGLVLASPVIIYELWAFVRPGLQPDEKRASFLTLLFGMVLFIVGAAFSYMVVMPFMLWFFMGINTSQVILPMISFGSYVSFVTSTLLTFGIVFEMPVVTILLTQIGLIKPEMLVKSRSVVILLIFIVAAIITPPDVVSQILVVIPMLILYEISIVICKMLIRKKNLRASKRETLDEAQ